LKERGVLLTILSKNNEPDVRAAFDAGLLAPLAADDFVAMKVDWKPKAENLQEIARELNLGLDAFVFVDDNPAERIEMAARLPEVAVASSPSALAAYFPEGEVTDEDRRKTEEYREEAARRKFLASAPAKPVDVWSALGAWCEVHLMRDDEAARVAQLSQRANQFATCTNRYTADEVAALVQAPRTFVYVVHAGDRFGDQGLVLFVVVRDGAIVDWTMSCRVAGRGLEERAWTEIERDLRAKGVSSLRASWKSSGKNAPVADLFSRLGFVKEASSSPSLQVYSKLIQYAPKS
jgi:FkbH-like protein